MVPDYQKLMLPMLQLAGDGKEHSLSEAEAAIAQHFALSEQDRKELLPSGTQRKLYNRIAWSRSFLVKAGILEAAGRGRFKITDRGVSVLSSNPPELTARFLEQFPEFVEFRGRQSRSPSEPDEMFLGGSQRDIPQQTPQEILETSYQILRRELAQEVLERMSKCSSRFFEELVVDLLVAMGYGMQVKQSDEPEMKASTELSKKIGLGLTPFTYRLSTGRVRLGALKYRVLRVV
jgi:restriction system protein